MATWVWQDSERVAALLSAVDASERPDVQAGIDDLLTDPSASGPIRVARLRAWPAPLKIAYLAHGWRLTFEIVSDHAGQQLLAARSLVRPT